MDIMEHSAARGDNKKAYNLDLSGVQKHEIN